MTDFSRTKTIFPSATPSIRKVLAALCFALAMLAGHAVAADATPAIMPTALIELDGSGSINPDGGTLAYRWTQIEGPSVQLSDSSAAKPYFRTGEPGLYRFELVVTANTLDSDPFVVEIMIERDNQPPVAKAPREVSVEAGKALRIDGSDSYDPEGKAITYRWRSVKGGLEIPLAVQGSPVLEIQPELDGIYQIELVVSDGETVSEPWITSLVVKPRPRPPIAIARAIPREIPSVPEAEHAMVPPAFVVGVKPVAHIEGPAVVKVGERVMLDAKASRGSDGGKVEYLWRQTAGPFIGDFESIYDGVAERFVPPRPGEYQFELVVSDGVRQSEPVFHSLRVTREPEPPVAVVVAPTRAIPGALVKLDATKSYAHDGAKLVYRWRQTGGPKVTRYLIDDSIGEAAPAFNPPAAGTYSFELTVSTGSLSSNPVEIDIEVADAGRLAALAITAPEISMAGQRISLAATGAMASASFVWRQVEGPVSILPNAEGRSVDISPSVPGRYTFGLSALENGKVVATARRSVEVFPAPAGIPALPQSLPMPPAGALPASALPAPMPIASASLMMPVAPLQPLLDMPPVQSQPLPFSASSPAYTEPSVPRAQSGRPAAQIHPSSLGTDINFLQSNR